MKRVFVIGFLILPCAGAWGGSPGKTATFIFTTTNSTGALVAADSTPTGAYWSDGVANPATTVAVTTTGTTGVYQASLTWPAVDSGSITQVVISATIGGVAAGAPVLIEDNLFPENVWTASTKAVTSIPSTTADAQTGAAAALVAYPAAKSDALATVGANVLLNSPTYVWQFSGTAGRTVTGATVNAFTAGAISSASIATETYTQTAKSIWDYAAGSCTTAASIGKKLYYWLTQGRIGNI